MAPRTSTKSTVKRKTTPKGLIEQRLQTPPNVPESDDDSVSADKNNDEEEKQKQNSCSNNDLNRISEPKKAISTTSFIIKNGEKVLMTMNREHSMFMNCIPLTRDKFFTQTQATPIRWWVCVCTIAISGNLVCLVTMKG